jgi:hypothetical protein
MVLIEIGHLCVPFFFGLSVVVEIMARTTCHRRFFGQTPIMWPRFP